MLVCASHGVCGRPGYRTSFCICIYSKPVRGPWNDLFRGRGCLLRKIIVSWKSYINYFKKSSGL